jgi:hypothetical protein
VRQALPLVLVLASVAGAQLPSDGRTSYSRDDKVVIPFDLPANNNKVLRVTLYSRFDGGTWQEADSIKPGGKKEFVFKADRDGPYGFATFTEFTDGSTNPPRQDQLVEQKRVVFDRTPPRIQSLRPVTAADGSPGIEWEVTDDNLDPRGIRLEFRWDGQGRYERIDPNVRFQARDSRHWKLKPRDRMQVKVVATDRAGNKAESDPVWVSGKDAGTDDPAPVRPTAGGTGGSRDAAVAPAAGTAAPSLHYVNNKKLTVNINATVGPSGLKKAYLWWADEKLVWQKWKDEKGPLPAPEVTSPDKPRVIPVGFVFEAPKDGLYNFIIVVWNHKFNSRPEPKNGEVGEIQVVVDTTKPTVEIVGDPQVTKNGDRGAVVDIRWRAQDTNIAPSPIKLEYQALKDEHAAGGEWKAVAPDWIDNTGQYTWTAPTGEGHLFKIRVTCKDRAGNENSAVTPNLVNIDLTRPGVDAVDVKPGETRPGVSGMTIGPPPDK